MKYIILAASFCFSAPAMAVSECAGYASDGSFVMVQVNTVGAMGIGDEATVSIERDGNKFGYKMNRDEIAQFFEFDDASSSGSVVGLTAYAHAEAPVSLRYVGPNFVDMDLKTVLANGQADSIKGNFLRVWKGPRHASTDQYQLTKVVCAVWSNL